MRSFLWIKPESTEARASTILAQVSERNTSTEDNKARANTILAMLVKGTFLQKLY